MLLLAIALPLLLDPAFCRQRSTGPARWETDGRGRLTISTAARFTGEVTMRCRVPVGRQVANVLLELDTAEASFQPAGSREPGSGVVIEAQGQRLEILRVAGEDWIRSGRRTILIPVTEGTQRLDVVLRLIDTSPVLPVRVDIFGMRITSAGAARDGE